MKKVTRLDAIKIFEQATNKANLWEDLMDDFYDETDDSFPTLGHVLIALGVDKEEYQQVTCGDNINWPEESNEDDLYLHNMSVEENDVVMQLSGSALHIMADSFVKQFKDSGAVNFLEIAFHDRETNEPFLLTLQRQEGIRPTDKIAALTKERDYLMKHAAIGLSCSYSLHNWVVGNQAAIIDAETSKDPAKGLVWVSNGLFGPGFLGDVATAIEEGTTAQTYFDANQKDFLTHENAVKKIQEAMEKELSK